jgi:hypothetical protein
MKSWIVRGALVTIAALAQPAHASYIEATFDGVAQGIENRGPVQVPLAEPVSGAFSFSTALPGPDDCCGPPLRDDTSLFYYTALATFPVNVFGGTLEFESESESGLGDYWPPSITWTDDGARQSISVDRGGPYHYWRLSLVDADRQLFHNLDPATVDFSQLDFGLSTLSFSSDIRSYHLTVALDQMQLLVDGVPVSSSVPEPGSLALFGAGLLSLAGVRRRKKAPR